MTDKEFDAYFSRLERASDSTRSIIYVFIVVYLALLMYSLQTFGYPARQFTYDDVLLQVKCRYESNRTSKCESLSKGLLDEVNVPPALKDDLEKDLWKHKLQLFYDDSVAQRTFQFPVFGATTELMLSSPSAEFNPLIQTVWYATAAFIASMPIIVCVLMIFDQIKLWQSPGAVLRLTILLVFLGLQGALLARLVALFRDFGRNQREAKWLVASLDPIHPGAQR
jgi:hypothetical protein